MIEGKYEAYPEYKDSDVEWLGSIPKGWSAWKLNHFAPVITCGVAATPEYVDEGVAFLSAQNVKSQKVDLSKGYKYISQKAHDVLTKNRTPKNGDILLSRVGTVGEVCIVDVDFEFSIFVSLTHLRLNQSICLNRFFVFLCQAQYTKALHGSVTLVGDGVGNLNVNDLREYRLPIPPCHEQQKIANFLDHETAKIDTLIEKQQQLIKLLKEKRQAVISHAVTKGLNPDVLMRDSGVEWLGEVPEHWVVSSLMYVLNAIGDVDHYMPKSVDDGIPYVMTGDLKELASNIQFDTCKQVSKSDYSKLSSKIKSSKGDVIMARYATIGTASYIDVDTEFLVSYSCVTIKPDLAKVVGLYLFYYFKSDAFLQGIQNQVNTNTQGNVGVNDLKKVKVALPPLPEQSELIQSLQLKLSKIDKISTRSTAAIILMQERRTALISAAVTGKIDVRNWSANA